MTVGSGRQACPWVRPGACLEQARAWREATGFPLPGRSESTAALTLTQAGAGEAQPHLARAVRAWSNHRWPSPNMRFHNSASSRALSASPTTLLVCQTHCSAILRRERDASRGEPLWRQSLRSQDLSTPRIGEPWLLVAR